MKESNIPNWSLPAEEETISCKYMRSGWIICLIYGEFLEKMMSRLQKAAKEAEDSMLIYAICGNCEKVITIIGQGEMSKEEKYYIL